MITETPEHLGPTLWRLGRATLPGFGRECFLAQRDGFDRTKVARGGIVFLADTTGKHGIPLPSILQIEADSGLILDRRILEEWITG